MAATNISGIYEIVNALNGKRYIGSSVLIRKRWSSHRRDLDRGKHHSPHLQRAWRRHGPEAFVFNVVEHVPCIGDLIGREQHYIDCLDPEYNCSPTAGSCLGHKWTPEQKARLSEYLTENNPFKGRNHTTETRRLLSEIAKRRLSTKEGRAALVAAISAPDVVAKKSANMSGNKIWLGRRHSAETKRKLSEKFKGRVFSDETRQKMSDAGRIRAPISEDTRRKMGNASAGMRNSSAIQEIIIVENDAGEQITGTPFEVRSLTGISAPRMTFLLNGKAKSSKGWRIMAAE